MKTILISMTMSVVTLMAFAGDKEPSSAREIVERRTGGHLRAFYRTSKTVCYVNAQKRASEELLKASLQKMSTALKTPISYTNAVFKFPTPEIFGELSLYVIDDEQLPMSLVAPEGRWAFVNVAPLAKGRGTAPAFFEARVKKEMARVGCLLLGGIGSTYKENLLSFVNNPDDLDKFEKDTLPIDGIMRCSRYLLGIGVKPWRDVTYRRACEEGWAPQPTNDIQRAVWKEVHEIPKNPMKIEFDPKKGK